MTKEELYELNISSPDKEVERQVKACWDNIAKPLDGLGKFETMIARIGAITGNAQVDISAKAVLVMCADNGIVAEGISQSGQEVTALVVESMARGQSSVCKMARRVGADVKVIDIGIHKDMPAEGILQCKIAYGTRNFLVEPAMSEHEALTAIQTGMDIVRKCQQEGYRILAMGEMGIGNTTTSSAVAAALLGCPVEDITGRGAGLSNAGLERKKNVIKMALDKYSLVDADPLKVLACVGGLDIAGLIGICIGGALYGVPIVLDGIISAVSALLAERIRPGIKNYLIASHISREPAARRIMNELELTPVLDADMALGEGTGAVMLLSLLDIALSVYEKQTSFQDVHIEKYQRSI